MDRGRKRWLLRLAVVILGGGVMLIYALRQQALDMLVIVNHSGQPIVDMKVTAGEESITFRNIRNGDSRPVTFVTKTDQRVTIRYQLQDGSLQSYLNGPVGAHLKIIVTSEGARPETGSGH